MASTFSPMLSVPNFAFYSRPEAQGGRNLSLRCSMGPISISQNGFIARDVAFLGHGSLTRKRGMASLKHRGRSFRQQQLVPSPFVSLQGEVASNSHGSELGSVSETTDTVDEVAQREDSGIDFVGDTKFNGKPGFVSFYAVPKEDRHLIGVKHRSLLWLLGPFVLVASVVLPPYVFRTVFEYLLDDTVVTDFIILFFTEAYFYIGVSAFLFIAHKFRGPVRALDPKQDDMAAASYTWGYSVSASVCTALSAVLAVSCFLVALKYTGPAVVAALAPYLSGLVIQFLGEKFTADKPAIRPLVPIIFQVYRLHQLNRAAQLVAGLIFSMKTVEASAQTAAITRSLQIILSSLQLLGIFSLWSLAAFLTQRTLAWHHGKGVSLVPF